MVAGLFDEAPPRRDDDPDFAGFNIEDFWMFTRWKMSGYTREYNAGGLIDQPSAWIRASTAWLGLYNYYAYCHAHNIPLSVYAPAENPIYQLPVERLF